MTIADVEPAPLRAEQVPECAEVLACAFHTNPATRFLFPNEARRRRLLPRFFAVDVRYGRLFGEVHTTPGAVAGAAVWLPPGETDVTLARLLRAGAHAAALRMGVRTFIKYLVGEAYMGRFHRRDMPADHWYLLTLGVDPARQRQGIGSALLRPVLRRADASGLMCYLETDKPEDIVFYERHGFAVLRAEPKTPLGGPPGWTMRRLPQV